MQWIEWLQRRPLITAALVGMLLGGLIGLAWPIQPGTTAAADPGNWALPSKTMALRYNERIFAKVRDATMWGTSGQGPGAEKLPLWRLTGTISRPAPTALIIADGSKTMVRAAVGQALPDGGKVLEISPRGIVFERKGCRYQRLLYAPVDPAEVTGCSPARAKAP